MASEESRPPVETVESTFETLTAPAAADEGETICRGTHTHDGATVEREYYRTDGGVLAVETAYVDGDRLVEIVEECWLLAVHADRRSGGYYSIQSGFVRGGLKMSMP